MRGARRLILLLAVTVLLPGGVLAVLGVRAFLQEREIADQQWRTRLEQMVGTTEANLTQELASWTDAIQRTDGRAERDVRSLPEPVRRAIAEPGVAAVRDPGQDGQSWPESALAYRLAAFPVPADVSPALLSAESIELREADYGRAIAQYRALLEVATGDDDRGWLYHRLARAYGKAHRPAEALHALDSLERLRGASVAGLPADFLARHEKWVANASAAQGALALLRDLVGGTWILDEIRYRYYVERLRESVSAFPAASGELSSLDALRARKETLTTAVSNLGSPERRDRFLVIRGTADVGSAGSVLVIDRDWLTRYLQVRSQSSTPDRTLRVVVSDGRAGPSQPLDKTGGTPRIVRTVWAGGVSWQVVATPADPSTAFADLARRQRIDFTMLAAGVVVLVFGTYVTSRVVRRELEVVRLKSDFIAAVSHEFRSPLTGIRQLGEMLLRGRVPNEERRQQYYERITRESDRLSRVVENLLDFARLEEGRRPFTFERVDSCEWLRQTVESFRSHEVVRTHRVVATIPETLPALEIDREALSTAVDNLMDNAVKYSPNSDTVWVDAESDGRAVVIRVRDRGPGIAPADQPHVFDRFYRGTQNGATKVGGTGLGLSLVRSIVKAHGGRLELDSQPGAGTTVSIHLAAAG